MNKIIESLDDKIFSSDLKERLSNAMDEAVEERSKELAREMLEDEKVKLNELLESYKDEIQEKAEEYVNDKVLSISKSLEEQYEEEKEEFTTDLNEKVNSYLDMVVEEFTSEIQDKLNENVDSERANAILDLSKTLAVLAGASYDDLLEAKEQLSESGETFDSYKERVDKLVNENIELKKMNEQLLKTGIIMEECEGLTVSEAEKFKSWADKYIPFTNDDKFIQSLRELKESIKNGMKELDSSDLEDVDNSKKSPKSEKSSLTESVKPAKAEKLNFSNVYSRFI